MHDLELPRPSDASVLRLDAWAIAQTSAELPLFASVGLIFAHRPAKEFSALTSLTWGSRGSTLCAEG
jgi:hypothetical protein